MRAGRLVSLLLLLQNRGRQTAAQLAAELEVSERTVYRDVDSLSAAGIPIYADRGTGGGYQLVDGYRTRLTGLTDGEADSLFLSGIPDAAAELGLGAEMAAANLKLLASLPESLRERAERVRSRFHLDPSGWFSAAEDTPHLAALAEAVWRQHTVAITYRRFDDNVVERTVDPLGLVLKGGTWYVIARPHTSRPGAGPRTFRVARLAGLTATGAGFARPDGFDLAGSWRSWSEEFEASRHTMACRVALTATGVAVMRDRSSPQTAAALPPKDAVPGPDGRFEVELPVESVFFATVEFASYGAEIEVLDPPELRESMRDHLRAALARYEGPAPRQGV